MGQAGEFFPPRPIAAGAVYEDESMTIELISPIAMEEGLRFAIREGGRTVGAGVVAKIME